MNRARLHLLGRIPQGGAQLSAPCTVAAAVTMCVLLISSCVSLPSLPSSPFRLAGLDTAPLRGKVIVIDPGHGGSFGGAVGAMGLKESEVNLGVALYLWGLLSSAGARPLLTRTADTVVASGTAHRLADDLSARSTLSNSAGADLFISIHHNSDTTHPRRNDLAVFYKLADPGASQELAGSVMERLREGFGAQKARVLPGNFSVLRKTGATAILGEGSYLTHRESERKLFLQGFLKLEAEAYFMGILDYCTRGIPAVSELSPQGGLIEDARPEVLARIVDDEHGKGIDPSSVRLYLDGSLVSHTYEPATGSVRYVPAEPLANGEHTVRVEAKNFAGNSAPPGRAAFGVSRPAASVEVHALPLIISPDGSSRCRITAEVFDDNLNPVADGTPVSFCASAGRLVDSVAETRGGNALTHLVAGAEAAEARVTVRCGAASASCAVSFASPGQGFMEIAVRDSLGAPVGQSEVVCAQERCCMTDRLGYCFVQIDGDEAVPFTVWKDGYRPARGLLGTGEGTSGREEVVLRPVDEGLLWHKVIMLDPRGEEGGDISDRSPERARAHDNLQVARCAQEMLKLAGARVVLTRGDGAPLSPAEKILRSEAAHADLVISLEHSRNSGIGYYFNSSKGKVLAGFLRQSMREGFSCKRVALAESTDFLVVHTSMPAVTVSFGRRGCKSIAKDEEVRIWKEAQVLFQAVRSYFMELSGAESARNRSSDMH